MRRVEEGEEEEETAGNSRLRLANRSGHVPGRRRETQRRREREQQQRRPPMRRLAVVAKAVHALRQSAGAGFTFRLANCNRVPRENVEFD